MATMTDVQGVKGLNRFLRKLPKEAKAELTDASKDIAGNVAAEAQGLARLLMGQNEAWKYLAPTIKAMKSSKPTIKMGGSKPLPRRYRGDPRGKGSPRGKATVGDLVWGLEFGGQQRRTTQQFLPYLGKQGYAMWPAVRNESEETQERYVKALKQAEERALA